MKPRARKLRAGDWVEVRSKEEILKTLDGSGQLDQMPFMPEMFAFCGRRFQVYKRAHKTCDTVFPIRARRVDRTVHLETRCDGQAHVGCEAGCLIFWKEAWLKRVNEDGTADGVLHVEEHSTNASSDCGIPETTVWAAAKLPGNSGRPARYVCQATQLPYATTSLNWWDIRQYLEDYWSGNVGLWHIAKGTVYSLYYNLSQAGIGVGPAMRWLYNKLYPVWRGTLFPRNAGTIPLGQATPTVTLNLQAGELVRVKPHREILTTIDTNSQNRGLRWDAEMVPYCGNSYRVKRRVTRILNEKTGEIEELKNPSVLLDSVVCQARYSSCRMFCPRSIYPFWREIWLERVAPATQPGSQDCNRSVRSE
jgi:hypothetical protein